ncbi:MAG: hypothetical protein RB296_01145 [Acidobacteriota bacterium]|jgi:hypothetical protein|nr:hypothetical protein [Acidobacteriota bacterium]
MASGTFWNAPGGIMTNKKNLGFIAIQREPALHLIRDLNPEEWMTYTLLVIRAHYMDEQIKLQEIPVRAKTGDAFMNAEGISEETGIDINRVVEALDGLKGWGLIESEPVREYGKINTLRTRILNYGEIVKGRKTQPRRDVGKAREDEESDWNPF